MANADSNQNRQALMNEQDIKADIHERLSRRSWLCNAAITSTGAVELPSFLTRCTKEPRDDVIVKIPGGVGGEPAIPLTDFELYSAAQNLTRMRALIVDLYPLCLEYEDAVFKALDSTKDNGNWAKFVANIFIDIGVGMAAATAIILSSTGAMPAVALLAAILKDWRNNINTPNSLKDEFAHFEIGHNKMQYEIEQKLSHLVDPSNNYSNLKAAWNDTIEFNNKTYTLKELAGAHFPGLGDAYNSLQTAAYNHFRKSLWNLVIMKCCSLYRNYHEYPITFPRTGELLAYAKETFYPQNKAVYLRAKFWQVVTEWGEHDTWQWQLTYWNLGINGYPFPDAAINELFIDDTPGHIINSKGLFNRSYVFEQFSITKPDFSTYGHELANTPGRDFADSDDWTFTGGCFPELTDQ